MYIISKSKFTWEASHMLHGLPSDHKCSHLHGHSYSATFVLQQRELNEVGFVRDFGDLSIVKQFIDMYLDHAHIASNEVEAQYIVSAMAVIKNDPQFEQKIYVLGTQTSAENIAKHLWEKFVGEFPDLLAVTVYETAKGAATFSPYSNTDTFYSPLAEAVQSGK